MNDEAPTLTTPAEPIGAPPAAGVRAKLKAYKRDNDTQKQTTLPATGITVSYNGFVSHDRIMAATKIAGKNRGRVGMIVVAQVCQFEGERLTTGEIGELLPNADVVHLINLVLGDDGDAEGASNGDEGPDGGN